MNLGEFIKSKKYADDGWWYAGDLHIHGTESGEYCSLTLHNCQYNAQEMYPLEGILYEYAIDEGVIDGPHWSEADAELWEKLFRDAIPFNSQDEGSSLQVAADWRLFEHLAAKCGQDFVDEIVHASTRDRLSVTESLMRIRNFILPSPQKETN